MDDVKLANWLAGTELGPIEVYRLDGALAAALEGRISTPVWLSDYTLTKIRLGHPDIVFADFRKLPLICRTGFVFRGRKGRVIEICHADASSSAFIGYRVCVKGTRKGEFYVSTFHRISAKEFRRLIKKAGRENRLLRGDG